LKLALMTGVGRETRSARNAHCRRVGQDIARSDRPVANDAVAGPVHWVHARVTRAHVARRVAQRDVALGIAQWRIAERGIAGGRIFGAGTAVGERGRPIRERAARQREE